MRWTAPSSIGGRVARLRRDAIAKEIAGDLSGAWESIGDAHVLAQPWPVQHVQTHWTMLMMGLRSRSAGEVIGQLSRLAVAAPGSVSGRYPLGNSGRADVSAFALAPVREDLATLLNDALSGQSESSTPHDD